MFDEGNTLFGLFRRAHRLAMRRTALNRDSLKAKESNLLSQHRGLCVLEFPEAASLLDFTL
jgi:hypothetical protein